MATQPWLIPLPQKKEAVLLFETASF